MSHKVLVDDLGRDEEIFLGTISLGIFSPD